MTDSSHSAAGNDWRARARAAAPTFLGQGLLLLTLWLTILQLPLATSSGLDPSWRMTIGYALGRGMQWGTELVFTYGPLGYLLASTNHGANYTDFLIWQGLSAAVFAVTIWAFGRQFRGWRVVLYYLYFTFLVCNYGDALHMAAILMLGLAWLHEPVSRKRWLVVAIGATLAILSLVKFTNFMLAGVAVASVVGLQAWRRRWIDVGLVGGSFAVTFLGGWLACGQNLLNLPAYVFTSLNASMGYGEGMAIYEDPGVFFIGVGGGLAIAAYYALTLWRRQDLPRAIAAVLIAAAASFINWKHGFTRADGHVFAHYIACLMVPVTFPVLLLDDGPFRRVKAGLLWIATGFSVAGIFVGMAGAIIDGPSTWNHHMKLIVRALWDLPKLKEMARADFDTTAKAHIMPATRRIVGKDTIDMLGNEQAYVLYNRFNFTPRPVFQTYLPYTAELLRLNEDFFKSDRAPKYVLQKMDTIDHRLPALEDALSMRSVYYHYSYILEEKGMLLWRRNDPNPSLDRKTLVQETKVDFGQVFPVPDLGDTPIWAEIDIQPSLIGRVRAFLYKAPILTIAVTEGNFKNTYRLIRRMASAGFLAYPHFSNAYNVQRFMAGDAPPRMATMAINLPDEHRKYFRKGVRLRFYSLPPIPKSEVAVRGSTEDTFRMFDRVPATANAHYPVTILQEGDREVLFAHPPSSIEFQVNFPASRVTGLFGFTQTSYTPPNQTDGGEFIIEWIGPDGRTTKLFSRVLLPSTVVADRGFQNFDVKLPEGGGRLVFRTTAGPGESLAFDWTYWTDIRFVP